MISPAMALVGGAATHAVVVWDKDKNQFAVTMGQVEVSSESDRSLAVRINIFCQLADSLNFLHHHGLRHWNLHNGNYIINELELPIIIDFGAMADHTVPVSANQNYDDRRALATQIRILGLKKCNIEPFNTWGPMAENFNWHGFPSTIHGFCTALTDMSVGRLQVKSAHAQVGEEGT